MSNLQENTNQKSRVIESSNYGSLLKTLPTKGRLAWEYNPFKNYRLNQTRYLYRYIDTNKNITRKQWYCSFNELKHAGFNIEKDDKDLLIITRNKEPLKNESGIYETLEIYEKDLLVDLDTDEFEFDLNYPVDILPQESYDGSVNLILNDGHNKPRIINSRFSPTGLNTYEIVDREGDYDTNIYDQGEQFDIDTSLYKRVNNILKIEFKGLTTGGNLQVGNYHFYFKLADADGNETDFIGQSGLVSVFIGLGNPTSSYTGNAAENSHKIATFRVSNIDTAYNYLTVYYTRASADGFTHAGIDYKKIDKNFLVSLKGYCDVVITGYENTFDIPALELNITYNIIDAAKTQALVSNMLFLGNVHKADIPYKELEDLSLRFTPKVEYLPYDLKIDLKYKITSKNKWYYDPIKIHDNVGYWPDEFYRFGVVYILKSGELSPVFNIRGGLLIAENTTFYEPPLNDTSYVDGESIRKYIKYNKETFLIEREDSDSQENQANLENSKGVISASCPDSLKKVMYFLFVPQDGVIDELSKHVKGFFFVRQKRIPTILALGVTVGIEKESHTPMIPSKEGVVEQATRSITNTHLTIDLKNTNYITEGFLTRYRFKFVKKKVNTGKNILKAVKAAAIVVGAAAAVVLTGGVAGLAIGGALAAVGTGGAALIGASILGAGIYSLGRAADLKNRWKEGEGVYEGWSSEPGPGYDEKENSNSRLVGGNLKDRLIIKTSDRVENKGIICPAFSVNPTYFNSIFTGDEHVVRLVNTLPTEHQFANKRDRNFYIGVTQGIEQCEAYTTKLVGVADDTTLVGIGDQLFRSRAGSPEEPLLFEYVGDEYKEFGGENAAKVNSDIIRGSFGPYLASSEDLGCANIVNIYIPGYDESLFEKYLRIRAYDDSPFYAISERFAINEKPKKSSAIKIGTEDKAKGYDVFGGDSYLCLFTQRIIRNFNDPVNLYNNVIVQRDTWKDSYDPNKAEKYADINTGDLNAVLLGLWVTFPVRSSYNLNIRSIDESNIDEKTMSGHARGFFPFHPMSTDGSFKIPEALVYNQGFVKSVSEQNYFTKADIPWIKNWFGTRIMYSDIHINDAFLNNYRVFRPTRFRDYSRLYGEITKLVADGDTLVVILEHGIMRLSVKAENFLKDDYESFKNVLPENPTIISDTYGSQWKDSILQTSNGIYGVDSVARKIWVILGAKLSLLSELHVQEFLNKAITLGENLLKPVIGRTNIKTTYNNFKHDVMFTFYNPKDSNSGDYELNGYDETVWNLCYSENLAMFTTFYSWVPSFMENIDNIPFSFDREVSRNFSILNQTNNIISLTHPVYDKHRLTNQTKNRIFKVDEEAVPIEGFYATKTFNLIDKNEIGVLTLELHFNSNDEPVTFEILEDRNHNNELFDIKVYRRPKVDKEGKKLDISEQIQQLKKDKRYSYLGNSLAILVFKDWELALKTIGDKIIRLTVKATISRGTSYIQTLYITTLSTFDSWSTDFWKHGQSGIIDITGEIKPTYWYGVLHPFEYEFVVNDNSMTHKIFDSLEIISNNVAPDSFHYEIVGDCYSFAKNKPRMYVRLEETKKLYFLNGGDILYDLDYDEVIKKHKDAVIYKLTDDVSTLFPQYYLEVDNLNTNINSYHQLKDDSENYDYRHLTGAEVMYYETLNEFRIRNHVKAIDMHEGGRIRGNMLYKEDRFFTLIAPIILSQDNENIDGHLTYLANDKINIPIVLSLDSIPEEVKEWAYAHNGEINLDPSMILNETWIPTENNSEVKPKDKWIKIRVHYTGSKLAIILAVKTYYSISYA